MPNGNQSQNQNDPRNRPSNRGATRPWNVLFPRNYTGTDGQEHTEFLRVGVAWPLKDKPGYRLEILGVNYVIMPQQERDDSNLPR
jgi:hypothetical protein